MIMFPFAIFCVMRIESMIYSKEGKSFGNILFYGIALLSNISMKHSKLNATRLIVGSLLFFALIANSLFEGNIVKNLGTSGGNKGIQTLNQLLHSDLQIKIPYSLTYVFRDVNGNAFSLKLKEIARTMSSKNAMSLEDELGIDRIIENKSMACLVSSIFASNYLLQFYDNQTGENLLTKIPESPFEFHKSMMAPKASPFIDSFNRAILQIFQSGVLKPQMELAIRDNDKIRIDRVKKGKISKTYEEKLSIHHLGPTFKFYLQMNGVAGIVCLFEILIHRFLKP